MLNVHRVPLYIGSRFNVHHVYDSWDPPSRIKEEKNQGCVPTLLCVGARHYTDYTKRFSYELEDQVEISLISFLSECWVKRWKWTMVRMSDLRSVRLKEIQRGRGSSTD